MAELSMERLTLLGNCFEDKTKCHTAHFLFCLDGTREIMHKEKREEM